jgi:DNA repair exonuclease SbcCD ATPase subunit
MSQVIKEEVRGLKGQIQTLDSSISQNSALLQNSIGQLNNLEENLSTAKDARIEELTTEIAELNEIKETHKAAFTGMNPVITECERAAAEARSSKSTVQINLSEIQKKLDLYSKNKCPHCLSDLTDEAHLGIKDKLLAKQVEHSNLLPEIDERILKAQSDLADNRSKQSSARDQYYQIDGLLAPLKRELADLTREDLRANTNGTAHLTTVISTIQASIDSATEERAKIQTQLSISQEMEVILSDNGMKRLLMSQIIPMLNKKILKTSKLLEFKFAFEFDLEFNPIITHLGMQISPDSLSAGEQKKMNLIVLLCILELLKLKHHKVNLLFLDEVFSSLDVESIYRVVDLLKTFAKKYNMKVFVISHDPLPEEFFDTKISVENVDHFSDIKIS